jgi:hypothetical protein
MALTRAFEEVRAELPLRRIWTLVPKDEKGGT